MFRNFLNALRDLWLRMLAAQSGRWSVIATALTAWRARLTAAAHSSVDWARGLPRALHRHGRRARTRVRLAVHRLIADTLTALAIAWGVLLLLALYLTTPPFILGTLAVLVVAWFVIPVLPGVVEFLSNQPNRFRPAGDKERNYEKDDWGFFTFLQPGRVKMLERGDSFVRALMDWDNRVFQGELPTNTYTPDQWEYWEVRQTPAGNADSHPLPFPLPRNLERRGAWVFYAPFSILFWVWKRWVYALTGGVFTGIPPYQTVRTYPMERYRLVKDEQGDTILSRILDYSDHYRVAEFQFPTAVPRADTQDMIEVKWRLNQIGQVINPFMVAYNTDDNWTARYFVAVANAVTSVSRTRPINQLISSANLATTQALGSNVTALTQASVRSFGMKVVRTEILDVTPTDPTIATKLGDVAVSIVDRDAANNRAVGLAAPTREIGKALQEYPEAALIPQNEAMVRAVQAAGDKAIVNFGDSRGGSAQAAILKEIRDISDRRRTATP